MVFMVWLVGWLVVVLKRSSYGVWLRDLFGAFPFALCFLERLPLSGIFGFAGCFVSELVCRLFDFDKVYPRTLRWFAFPIQWVGPVAGFEAAGLREAVIHTLQCHVCCGGGSARASASTSNTAAQWPPGARTDA